MKEYNGTPDQNLDAAVIVGRYGTPLAVVLVVLAVVLSSPKSPIREIAVGLLFLGIVFNLAAAKWIKSFHAAPLWLLRSRVWVNFSINVCHVYLLGAYFSPIWLLLLLQAVAIGIYDSRARTWVTAILSAGAILAIQASRGHNAPVDWGIQIANSMFILLASLMANGLAQRAKHRCETCALKAES